MTGGLDQNKPAALIALIAVQMLCAAFFVGDVLDDAATSGAGVLRDWHLVVEGLAVASLVAAIVFEMRYLARLLARKARLEQSVSAAAGALQDVIEAHFADWGLTPAEQDVALFTIKGFTIAEIAEMRGSAAGTVKSQLNAIYRKAGVTGRGGLLALLIEDILDHPLLPDSPEAA